MRVSAESNDLNSARVGFSSFRPRARDVDRYRARPRNRRKKFSHRASAACVSRVRPVVEASRARLRVPRDARAHAADVFSKRTNFSTRVLGYFKGHEPSMDLKSSKRQLKIFNARARTDRKGPQRLYFVRFFTTLMVYCLVSVLYFPQYGTGCHRQEIRADAVGARSPRRRGARAGRQTTTERASVRFVAPTSTSTLTLRQVASNDAGETERVDGARGGGVVRHLCQRIDGVRRRRTRTRTRER